MKSLLFNMSYIRFRDGESVEEAELVLNEELSRETGPVDVYQATLKDGDVVEVSCEAVEVRTKDDITVQ